MSNYQNQNRSSGLSGWLFPILFLVVFPPIGLLLVVLKLLGGNRQPRVQGRHPYYAQQERQAPVGARTTRQSQASGDHTAKKLGDQLAALAASGKKLTLIGGIITGLFGFAAIMAAAENLWMLPDVGWFLEELLPFLCLTSGGLGCLGAGLRKKKQVRRYRNYLAMIGARQSISISSLASATGLSPSKVREDLEDMLSKGLFPTGFLDYGSDALVLSADGLQDQPRQEPVQPRPDQTQENAILSEIREVNDEVDDEKLSAQIDRIGVITAKILDYQKQHPEKAPQLHSFLSYYLPTTLKILRAYGQLEDQQVAGENITAAMQRIEGMMDKVVEGFEKQLDQLFQSDAMDITTDVEVLERMLAKDGLSNSQGLTLGL